MSASTVAVNLGEASLVEAMLASVTADNARPVSKVVAPVSIPICVEKHDLEQVDEAATTDAGSCDSSDTESCSSAADVADKVASFEEGVLDSGLGPLGYRRRASQRSLGNFGGTPLEPIPGTPVASKQAQNMTLLSTAAPAKLSLHCEFFLPSNLAEGDSGNADLCATVSDIPAMPPPRSPKRRVRPAALIVAPSGQLVNAVALGPFGTAPAVALPGSPKKRARDSVTVERESSDGSAVTSVRCSVFGTVPAAHGHRSPKRRSKATSLTAPLAVKPPTCEATIGAPPTPSKQARDATMAKAKRNGVPLKLRLPDHLKAVSGCDPCLPVKKKPVFADVAGPEPAAALLRMQPSMPVKMRVTPFLLEETFCSIQPPPGLKTLAQD